VGFEAFVVGETHRLGLGHAGYKFFLFSNLVWLFLLSFFFLYFS
jgi:hypothetical protein